jgi:hypothetical protein
MRNYHHYCNGRIATQFCSFSKKKNKSQEWMATHLEEQFDSLRKLSGALEYFMDVHYKSWRSGGHEQVNLEVFYPVLLVQGRLLDVRPGKRSLRVVGTDHIQYRRSALIERDAVEYQIDVVTEKFFSRYLQLVERETLRTARLLRRRHVVVRRTIEKIARAAKGLRSPEKIRAAMEM